MSRIAKIRRTLKTSDGLNTWTFRAGRDFQLKVSERKDGLYQAEGPADGVGEKLSEAVLAVKEKAEDYAVRNGLTENPNMMQELAYLDEIARYFAVEIGS